MPEIILSDYFYGDESEEFVFFKIPRQLITDPKFKHVSTDAKLLYGMLLDRMSLSARNDWYDSDTWRVYIYYTVEEICEDRGRGYGQAVPAHRPHCPLSPAPAGRRSSPRWDRYGTHTRRTRRGRPGHSRTRCHGCAGSPEGFPCPRRPRRGRRRPRRGVPPGCSTPLCAGGRSRGPRWGRCSRSRCVPGDGHKARCPAHPPPRTPRWGKGSGTGPER
nr:replication initiator protein A [uncultured Oscillibacter sp.]